MELPLQVGTMLSVGGLLDNKENKHNISLDEKCCAFD